VILFLTLLFIKINTPNTKKPLRYLNYRIRFAYEVWIGTKTPKFALSMTQHHKTSNNISTKREGSQSIRRAISLIRAVSKYNNEGVRLTQAARDVDLHVATARRMLRVLNDEGFIGYDRSSKRYYLGAELFSLGTAANQFEIRNLFRPALERVAKQTEETVFLVIRLGNDSLCIDRLEGSAPIRIMPYQVGTQTPLGVGAGALALIYLLPDEEIEAIISANEIRYSQYNAVNKESIRDALTKSRKLNFSLSQGLYIEGVGGVGLPIVDNKGEIIAAISVCSLAEKLDPDRCQSIASLVKAEIDRAKGNFSQVG
jgi:DNA-binding IclR family transcriptional regulator